MYALLEGTVVAISTSAQLMTEVKISLKSQMIQYLATADLPPISAQVTMNHQEGHEIMAIFKELSEHGYILHCLK